MLSSMGTFTLSKKFRFESAHRLCKGYEGKCRNIHGHSWNGELFITGTKFDNYDFLIDYSLLKKITKQIEDSFDHKLLVYQGDEELLKFCQDNEQAYYKFDRNPTSEAIARTIYFWAVELLEEVAPDAEAHITAVKVDETCTSSCLYKPH